MCVFGAHISWLLGYLQAKRLLDLDSLGSYQCFYSAGSSAVICVHTCDSFQKNSLTCKCVSKSRMNIFYLLNLLPSGV